MKGVTINLKNINIEEIHKKYDVVFEEKTTKTNLNDLFGKKNTISFFDESMTKHTCDISIPHFNSSCKYSCFWDRNPIPTGCIPIGCPLSYKPHVLTHTYTSHINKDKDINRGLVTIKGNITEEEFKSLPNKNVSTSSPEYITDGIFCSFNCVQAYINEYKTNSFYNMSSSLLLKIYKEYNPEAKITRILPAGHWRLLKEYGGHMTIEEFRSCFNVVEFEPYGIVKFKSIGHIYEEKISIN